MTLLDFFQGHWTWMQLVHEVWPVVVPAVVMFWVGYQRGRLVEVQLRLKELS